MCTAAKGGMLSVVEGYRRSGLFDECKIRLILTHDDSGLGHRLWQSLRAMVSLLRALLFERVGGVRLHSAM